MLGLRFSQQSPWGLKLCGILHPVEQLSPTSAWKWRC